MSVVRSSPSSVAACCSYCLTDARATIVEVMLLPRITDISLIWTRAVSSCLTLVLKQYGRAAGLKASLPYIACGTLIFMIAGTELGPGMIFNHQGSALVV